MNYMKFGKQFVCKMAVVLAAMLAACTTEDVPQPLAGGASVEEGFSASLENITIAGMADNMVMRMRGSADPENYHSYQNYSVHAALKKGTIVTAYELDSVSLDTTGRYFVDTVYNDSGSFAFENLSLNSPYMLIRVQDSCFRVSNNAGDDSDLICQTLSAIVDVRESRNVGINFLTRLKSIKVRELVGAGIPFATANDQAEREILETFRIYETLGNFESLDDETRSELNYVNQLAVEFPWEFLALDSNTCYWYIAKKMAEWNESEFPVDVYGMGKGTWLDLSETVLNLSYLGLSIYIYWGVPLSIFPSEEMERNYLESLELFKYEVNYLAKYSGLEPCTEQREGDTFGSDFICRSGKWQWGYKWIDHTNGVMVDNRDGKSYKTVTYNIDGKPQTWLAENLNYAGTSLTADSALNANLAGSMACYAFDNSSCDTYGRLYEWRAAMNLSDEALKVFDVDSLGEDTLFLEEICKRAFYSNYLLEGRYFDSDYMCYWGENGECVADYSDLLWECVGKYKSHNSFWDNFSESIDVKDPSAYQGICPDGWRLPTKKDWNALERFVKEQDGNDSVNVGNVMKDEYAMGFGLRNVVRPKENSIEWVTAKVNPALVDDNRFYGKPYKMSFVRCIKND